MPSLKAGCKAVLVTGVCVWVLIFAVSRLAPHEQTPDSPPPLQTGALKSPDATNAAPAGAQPGSARTSLRLRTMDFNEAEKEQFKENFRQKYKPALLKWAQAYAGRLPFSPESLSPENLVERIGRNSSFNEYIFLLGRVTLGIQDRGGEARVDYLNDPDNTRKLAALPSGTDPPSLTTPVTKSQVIQMLEADSGRTFKPRDVRLTPAGTSGQLNGGALVHVGGNPENFASWKFDLVFAPDGSLAYYLRGFHADRP